MSVAVSEWTANPGATVLAVTRPGHAGGVGVLDLAPDGGADLTTAAWAGTGTWQMVGWAGPDALALRRRVAGRGELGILDTGRRVLTSHPVVGRTVRVAIGRDGQPEALVAVVRDGDPVLCRYRPADGSYQVLAASAGVSSVAAWDPVAGTVVLVLDARTGRRVVVLGYDGTAAGDVSPAWPPDVRPVSAGGDAGPLVAVTGRDRDGRDVPGLLDLTDGTAQWFPSWPGHTGVAVAPSGRSLLTLTWAEHRYLYRVLDREGEQVGTIVPGDGIATGVRFTADEQHLLGRHQSPAATPAIATWDLHSGRMDRLRGEVRTTVGMRWRHRWVHVEPAPVPEWLYEPEAGGHGGVVLHLHGGPRSQLRQIHEPVIAALAGHGWTVIGLNYPGSSGYTEEFRDVVVGDWGGADAAAVAGRLRGLRAELGGRPLCLYGQSYGGYLALVVAAAAPELADAVGVWAPVTDLPGLVESAAGVRRRWLETELGALAGDPHQLRERSPVTHPPSGSRLLVGHSTGDDRCPVEQSRRLVRELRRLPACAEGLRYVEQRGEGHAPADTPAWAGAVVAHLGAARTAMTGAAR